MTITTSELATRGGLRPVLGHTLASSRDGGQFEMHLPNVNAKAIGNRPLAIGRCKSATGMRRVSSVN